MIQTMSAQLLEALLPMRDDKKVTDNRMSREKAAKRESLKQSSIFGQQEVDIGTMSPEVPAVGGYVYNAAQPTPSKSPATPPASPPRPKESEDEPKKKKSPEKSDSSEKTGKASSVNFSKVKQ